MSRFRRVPRADADRWRDHQWPGWTHRDIFTVFTCVSSGTRWRFRCLPWSLSVRIRAGSASSSSQRVLRHAVNCSSHAGDAPVLRLLWRREDGAWRIRSYDGPPLKSDGVMAHHRLWRVTWHQFRIHSSLINDLNAPVKIARAQTRTRLPLQLSPVPMIVWRCAAWL
jgi:hypothetical protein